MGDSGGQSFWNKVLDSVFAKDNVFSKTLSAVIKKLRSQNYIFVVGIGILLVLALSLVYIIKPEVPGPFYGTLFVIFILALAALSGVFKSVPEERKLGKASARENKMPENVSSYEALKKQVERAESTLDLLEQKAAGIPVSERTISLTSDLENQRQLVESLRAKLQESVKKG